MQTNVLDYLSATAARTPDRTALIDGDARWSFAQLDDAARAAASAILDRTQPNGFVGVLCDRQAIGVTGMLAALWAGCCYVPLDLKMPEARMRAILEQVRPDVVLYAGRDEAAAQRVADFAPAVCIEQAVKCQADDAALCLRRAAVLDVDPAYVIFTSGSTGTPKGIPITHRGLIDFTDWLVGSCRLDETTVLGCQAPLFFDTSLKNLMPCFAVGATVHLLPQKFFSFPLLCMRYLNEHRINTLIWSTAAFHLIANSGALEREPPKFVRTVAVGGEALMAPQLNRWRRVLPEAVFYNHYGPTETAVDCLWYPIARDFRDDEPIPIGGPCHNMQALLLDEAGREVPRGEPGELCIRGGGLSPGYLGDPEKTAEAFIQNPLETRFPDRIYRTGDLARYNDRGELMFLGRRDAQIKHMGYRIELGEVETAVCAVPGVEAAACLFDAEADAIVCFCQTGLGPDALAKAAKERLPKYMCPNVWRISERLPHNANGKLDRAALKRQYFDGYSAGPAGVRRNPT